MNRIYHPNISKGLSFLASSEDHRHLFKSLRVHVGDELEVGDGKGNIAEAIVELIDKKECRLRVEFITHHEKRNIDIVLAFSILKSDSRMEWLVEKAVELNADAIVPLISERCEKSRIKSDRLHRICISAYKQSLNPYLTRLEESMSFENFVENQEGKNLYIAVCEGDRMPISDIHKEKNVSLLIGPEGDFTKDEVNFAVSHGAQPIILGDMRLRSETAAIASLAYINLSQAR